MKSSDDTEIVRFNVESNTNGNINSLKPMKEDKPNKSNSLHKFSGNMRFMNDEYQIQTDLKRKENKINFAMLFSSPKSNSPSISPRNITAISPRKIIDNILKSSISPRTRNHELLSMSENDDDEQEHGDTQKKLDIEYNHDVHRHDELQLLNSMRMHKHDIV
eukprot:392988_1